MQVHLPAGSSRSWFGTLLIALACLRADTAAAQHGIFTPPSVLVDGAPLGGQALDLEAGDVNGDGLPDLVAAVNGGKLAIVRGVDHLQFAPPVLLTGIGANNGIALADFDEDGHLDVVAGGGGSFVAVLLGHGDGSFAPALNVATPPGAQGPTVGDVNGDGHADIAVPCETAHRVAILLGGGGGGFVHVTDAGPIGAFPRNCALGDVDQDGDLDLVVDDIGTAAATLLTGNGDGSFGVPTLVPLATSAGARLPLLSDLDGDSDPELIVSLEGGATTNGMEVFPGLAGASFGAPVALDDDYAGRSFALDVNEDGAPDVIASGSGVVNVYLGDGRLGFGPALRAGLVIAPLGFVVADLDLDGDLDAAGGGFLDNTLVVARGFGDGTFAPYQVTGAETRSIAVPDLDGDGLPDFVSANLATDNLTVLRNLGQGRLAELQTVTGLDDVAFVEAGDFDGDGLPDVVAASRSPFTENFWLLHGNGDGTLAAPSVTNFGFASGGLDSADFDGDGDLDLAVNGRPFPSPDATVYVMFNDGRGAFAGPVSIVPGTTTALLGVAAGDWDLDGDEDLASCRAGINNALWFNDGTGQFSGPVWFPGDGLDDRVVAADFDGDADLDLIALGFDGGHAILCRNTGGKFVKIADYFNKISYPADASVGDVDNDGDPDVVFSANYKHDDDGRLALVLNDGSGNFAAAPILIRTMMHPWAVVLDDFDGDGVADAAFSSQVGLAGLVLSTTGPWADEDHPLAGTLGLPKQVGEGTLVAGEHFRFTLHDARPLTTAYHVVGVSAVLAPLKGGVLVPSPDFINPFPVTDALGNLTIEGSWIVAPSGLTLHFQFWLPDPAGIKHFAASNSVSATLP